MLKLAETLAVSAGILQFTAYIPIIYGTLKGNIKPSTTANGIWAFVSFALLFSSYASGVRSNLPFIISGCFANTIVFILSLKLGYRRWSIIDPICLILGVSSLLIWYISRQASYGVYILTIIDWIAIVPVIRKSWLDPWSESKFGWSINFYACLLLILSIRDWRLVTVLVAFTQISHSVIINLLLRLSSNKSKNLVIHEGHV